MATQFRSNFDYTHPISDTGAKVSLAANTELTWTVPGTDVNIYRADFKFPSGAQVWVKLNGAVVVPVANTAVTVTNEEFLPDCKYVKGGDVLHFISTAAWQCGVSLLSVPN